ncbi:MAG: DsbA family protein [Candidatus Latescibacterota bacterium]
MQMAILQIGVFLLSVIALASDAMSQGSDHANLACEERDVPGKTGPMVVMVFSDFLCSFCADVTPLFHRLWDAYPDVEVQVLFEDIPSTDHPDTLLVHEAALAAGDQGQFWEMHDLIPANQKKTGRKDLIGYARQLDMDTFIDALNHHKYRTQIVQDCLEA